MYKDTVGDRLSRGLVNIEVIRQKLAISPSRKLDQIVDFNLYMVEAILNGRGVEIVEPARAYMFRKKPVEILPVQN